MLRPVLGSSVILSALACTSISIELPADSGDGGPTVGEAATLPGTAPATCPAPDDLYDPDCIVRYEIELDREDWAKMERVHDETAANCGATDWGKFRAWYPATLTYGAESLDVGFRLKGNPCSLRVGGKMQFRVDLDYADASAEFHGLSSLNLEAAPYDPTWMKNTLASSVFADADVLAPRANFATLHVNGSYYGLFENIEQINGSFVENHFDDDSGNLYWFIWNGHYGSLESNEEQADTSDWDEMEALANATPASVSLEEFTARIPEIVDVTQLIRTFAAEAVMPQTDGVWAGSANCYMYHDPLGCSGAGCFVYLPWDLDSAFTEPDCPGCEALPPTIDADPFTFITGRGPAAHWRVWDLLMEVPAWRQQFIDEIASVLDAAYVPEVLVERHQAWMEAVRPELEADPHVDLESWEREHAEIDSTIVAREAWLREWLAR